MENAKEKTATSKRLKTVVIVLAVLLALSVGGLVGRMIYLRFFAAAQTTAEAPDNLVGEKPSSVSREVAEGVALNSSGGESALARLAENEIESAPSSAGAVASGSLSENETAGAPAQAVAARAETRLELYEGKPGDNRKFEAGNMLPGDTETKYFRVKVYHDRDVDLFFRADVTEQTKALGDALRVKVTRTDDGAVLFDAPFNGINGRAVSQRLKADAEGSTVANYRIDVSLDTSADNTVKAAALKANFEWYVEKEDGLTPPPQTGERSGSAPAIVAAISLLSLLILAIKRRKEGERREQA